jgi:hypothetical protein
MSPFLEKAGEKVVALPQDEQDAIASLMLASLAEKMLGNTSAQRHSVCLKCFRKQWPRGRYSSWQVPGRFRKWEVCCFCLKKHKDGIHKPRGRNSSDLKCGGIHGNSK